MEFVQQAQSAQVQEPTTEPVAQQPTQQSATEPTQAEPQQKGTLTAEDFANMPDEEKLKILQQIETAQSGVQSDPQEPEQQEPNNLYSLEDFNAIDLSKQMPDVERLPYDAQQIHKKYMDYFNAQILPQLQELQRIKAAQQPQTQQQQPTFNDVVAMRVMQNLGTQQLDMQDPRTALEISKQSNLLAQELQSMQAQEAQRQQYAQHVQNIFTELKGEIKDFDMYNQWANEELENLPVKTHRQIIADIQSGDKSKIKAVYDFFINRYAQQHGGQQPATNTEQTPPSVLGGSMGEPPAKSFSYNDFENGSEDEQKKMLIDAGLI